LVAAADTGCYGDASKLAAAGPTDDKLACLAACAANTECMVAVFAQDAACELRKWCHARDLTGHQLIKLPAEAAAVDTAVDKCVVKAGHRLN
jgi:hypothetical protein